MKRLGITTIFTLALTLPAFETAAQAPVHASLPAADPRFAGQVGRTYRDSSPATLPRSVQAPQGAPNIIVIMLDDSGFGQYATFGGAIPSPAMDKLASEGLRYNRFHTAGICSPTRAALLTGRNPHQAGFGIVGELATGYDGYTGVIPQSTATVARVLRDNGYATAMFGKNHNTPAAETGPAGPFNHWPNAMGFEYFYGFNAWGTSQWQPLLFENNRPVPPSGNPDYHLTVDLADHAIAWVRNVKATSPDKPYFLYLSTGAMHAPHHAPKEWIDRFKGQFDGGWDQYREQAFARQKHLGVIPADAVLTPRPAEIPAWKSLPAEKRRILAREMEVFAGFAAHTDAQIGRVLDLQDNNTLVFYIAGDNGASAEGGADGTISEIAPQNRLGAETTPKLENLDGLGGPGYNNNFAAGWAWAANTPFRYYKQVVSHLGAIRNPLIVSWPARVKDNGGLRSQFFDVTDIAPTLLAATGIPTPAMVDGVAQKPLDGVSMLQSLDSASSPEVRQRQYFEVFANRGIYDHGWFASAKLADPWQPDRASLDPDKVQWELYDLNADFTQANDLATRQPAKLQQLKELWWAEAARNDVLPLDWRAGERLARKTTDLRTHFTFYPGLAGLPEVLAPVIRNRSWTITANGRFEPADNGVLITQGGMTGGWALYLRDGHPIFDYNLALAARYRVAADAAVPAGTRSIEVRFAYEGVPGKEVGKGGTVTLFADGHAIGSGHIERTLTAVFSLNEGMDVGADYGSPAGDYPFPFPFHGDLQSVVLDLK